MSEARPFRLRRRRTDRVFAGVAGGLADTLGVSDAYVRAAFVALFTVWGLGAAIYLILWLATYERVEDVEYEPVETMRAVGLGIGFAGLMLLLGSIGWWPSTAVVVVGTTLAFGTAAFNDKRTPRPLAALVDPSVERPGRLRVVFGGLLLVAGVAVFATSIGPIFEVGEVLLAILLTALGVFVAFGPWVRRLVADLATERTERIRQEERAEMAAHLHDSVLQTLALIQRTDDPARMAILARHQESELRDWLYGAAPLDGVDHMSTALKSAAGKVEVDHQVPVDVVTVGDRALDDRGRALVGAATEAMVNGAKHSGAPRLSLYFEADENEMTVYVTDQGKGFDPASVAPDRKGIAQSIRARLEKVGGSASVSSEPGEGTEVVMRVPVEVQ